MIRLICLIPEGIRPNNLSTEQQEGLKAVLTQYTLPMPGTIAANGFEVVDGVVQDNFDPQAITDLGLPLTVLGMWQWTGRPGASLAIVQPLDAEAFLPHLPDEHEYDEAGNVTATHPATLHIPHNWSGWPSVELPE
jgi:hypothetical protein